MTTLVVGASGATGRLLVGQLLDRDEHVRVVVRAKNSLPESLIADKRLSVTEASLLDLDANELQRHVDGCSAVASCLGHNLSFKGMFGQPRRLVTDATRRLCDAVRATRPDSPVRYVLMNSSGNSNRDLDERISRAQQIIIWLLRHLLPPHADNEEAADYLRLHVGQHDPQIEWVAVRPDGLIDKQRVTPYEAFPSPTKSAIFDAGSISRINVADFMARLILDDAIWQQWQGQMPVVYDRNDSC